MPQAANPLYVWLRQNKYAGAGKDGSYTNLALDGGKFSVPEGEYGAFLNKYVSVLQKGHTQFMVERRTPVFKLFVDLDIKAEQVVAGEAIRALSCFILQQSRAMFQAEELVVCTAEPRRLEAGGWKTGVHLYWPEVLVNDATALVLRDLLVARCESRFGLGGGEKAVLPRLLEGWEKVVDQTVYKGSGLRMLYSAKGPAQRACYEPALVVREGGVEEVTEPRLDLRAWVVKTSIRCAAARAATAILPSCPQLQQLQAPADSPPRGALLTHSVEEHAEGLHALHEQLAARHPEYSDARFTGLSKGDNCWFLRTTSRHCQNLELDAQGGLQQHSSNNIYFLVSATAVYQKCFCRCDTEAHRRNGRCQDYRSEPMEVPQALLESLFGVQAKRAFSTRALSDEDLKKRDFGVLFSSCQAAPAPKKKAKRRRG